jgi:hypothetical protein
MNVANIKYCKAYGRNLHDSKRYYGCATRSRQKLIGGVGGLHVTVCPENIGSLACTTG